MLTFYRLLASFGLPERAKYGVEQGSARPTGFLDITESALASHCPCERPETLPSLYIRLNLGPFIVYLLIGNHRAGAHMCGEGSQNAI